MIMAGDTNPFTSLSGRAWAGAAGFCGRKGLPAPLTPQLEWAWDAWQA
jgi:hypothetical protein